MRTIAYFFRGQLWWARAKSNESIMQAVVRSIDRKITGPVTCWWSECRDGHDVYTAKWFDTAREVYEEAQVII